MPDMLYAKPRQQPPTRPIGYAMISSCLGGRGTLLPALREAGRSNLMIPSDRSTLSCRAFLFLVVLLGTPIVAHSDALGDSAKELAQKIAASLPAGTDVSLGIQNSSSLSPEEVGRIEQVLKAELQTKGNAKLAGGFAEAMVAVTLSENFKSFVWTAEIHSFDADKVVFTAVPHPIGNLTLSNVMPVTLRGQKYWEGPERILDALTAPGPGGSALLILLLPDGLAIRDVSVSTMTTVKIPFWGGATRDPLGILELHGNFASARFPFRDCTVNLESLQLTECHALDITDHSVGDMGIVSVEPINLLIPGRVSTVFMPGDACGAGLTTSSGDDTQPDWAQALSTEPPGVAISNRLDFPGPVLALRPGSGESRAIVRNLKTGNYEAYRLTCQK